MLHYIRAHSKNDSRAIYKPANHRLHMHAQILHSKDTGGKCDSSDMRNFNWLPTAGCVSAAYLTACTLAASHVQLISSTKGLALRRREAAGKAGHQVYNLLN